ncbi:PAS domain-containing protein [Ideonella sp. A 288]|uniref:PAS domain-containing protein n=1 Tax=Ideonella sp. A 288 TaxID=1962181 RepID=UPI000B4BE2CA|nr:PAS domain-containing protein [Ideonella sp. A 288]
MIPADVSPPAPDLSRPPMRWTWRHTPWIGGLFIAVIVGLAGFDILRGRQATIGETGRELDAQARVIAEQTARSLQTVDLVLRHIANEHREGKLGTPGDEAALHAYLRDQVVGLVQVEGLSLIDVSGRVRASSNQYPLPVPPPDVSTLPGFQQLVRHGASGMVLGGTMRGLFHPDTWIFPLARRLDRPDGGFAGVVAAGGRVDYFQHFYRDVRLDEGTRITLMHRDGTLVARHPAVESALGQRFALLDTMLAARESGQPGPTRLPSPVDGVDRFGAVELVPDFPLAVVVTRDTAVALAPWRAQAIGTVARTLALGILATALLALVRRQFERLDRTRESLEHSRERFALAAAGSDEGIWDWDVAGDRIYASARAREIFGLPPGPDVQPRSAWFAALQMHPDDVAERSAALGAHLSGRTPVYAGEYRVRHPDGSHRWIRVRGLCVRDERGQPLRMSGSVTDIDAHRRAEDALRLSEQRFALAVAGSKDGIVDWDVAGDRMYTSERMLEMIGAPTDVTVRSRAEWVAMLQLHPDDREAHAKELQRFLASDETLRECEYRLKRADGEYGWVRLRNLCVRDADGRPLRLAGSVSDIDAYKRVEAALRVSEERYALAMTGSNEGHWVWNVVDDELYTSTKLNELLGQPGLSQVNTYAGYFSHIAIHPDDFARVRQARDDHLAGRTPQLDVEYRILMPGTNEVRWIHTRGQCFRDADGRPLRVAGSTRDATQRKRSEEALRASEERFALAVAGSDDGVWDFDYVAGRVFGSRRAREILGLPLQPEVQPMDDWHAALQLHPDDAPLRVAAMQAHLSGLAPAYEGEWRVRHGDGRYRWVRVRGMCVRDEAGTPLRMAGSVSDIDARKRAEESQRQSEERYALAVAGSDDGVWDWDLVAGVAFESTRARELQALPPGPEVQPLADLVDSLRVHPDDAPVRAEALRAHLAGESAAYECEYRVRHDDGQHRWIRVRAVCVRDADGRPTRMAGSVSDIDARKRTEQALRDSEEALRRSEERFQLAVAGSNEGLWDWDLDSDRLFLSPRAQDLLWLTPGQAQRPRREWIAMSNFHPDDRGLVRDALAAHLRGETRHFKVEFRLQHAGGDWRWYRQRGIAVRDAEGRPMRMAGSMEDITDRKASEAERERLEGQLRQAQKLEAIGTLAGGIAHDFNNILAAILGYGEMAQKDAPEGSAQRRHIDAAMSAGMRAKSLVERILAFSRSGMGERVPVHVQSVVDEALDAVAASLPAGIRLERQLAADDAAVLGDPTQVHQVVMNLCANAVQAMKSAGTLTVTLDRVDLDAPRCATSVLAAGNYVRLAVRDTGTGIAAHLLERIFDPFFTTKEVGVGTGLGLSLVHGIVTDLGGGIDVDSRPGEGTTFRVLMPWQGCVAQAPRVELDVPPGAGETVLLVDDEEALVRLGEEMIAALGYEPVGFTSSVAALEAFCAEPGRFDAVLSDEAMPEMTGSELARAVRTRRADIPIVLMSGYVTTALTQRARDAGVADVLAKPLVAGDIARSLAAALQRGRGRSSAEAAAPH